MARRYYGDVSIGGQYRSYRSRGGDSRILGASNSWIKDFFRPFSDVMVQKHNVICCANSTLLRCRPFIMVGPLCVSTVCEVLTLNSPPVTHVTHVAERRLADRLAKAVSYEITDEIATSGVLQIPSRFLSATC